MSEPQEVRFPDSPCFGCSRTNESGLGLRFWRDGSEIFTRYAVPERFSGAPGKVHGGILGTIIDEVSCAVAVFVQRKHVVTGELTVRYLKSCFIDTEIEVRARITGERPRYWIIESDVYATDDPTTPLARSSGRFFPIGPHDDTAP